MDRANHDFLGTGNHSFRSGTEPRTVLCGPLFSRNGRGKFFSRNDSLPHPLDPAIRTSKGRRYLVRRNPFVSRNRVAAGRVDARNRLARYGRMALAFCSGRCSRHRFGDCHAFLSDGLAERSEVARDG
jgi:hypothetical protein